MRTLDYFDKLLLTVDGYNQKYPQGNTPRGPLWPGKPSVESRDLFGNERRSPHIFLGAVRAYTAIQRTQETQETQMIQTSLKIH
jgi:hypothetical protein